MSFEGGEEEGRGEEEDDNGNKKPRNIGGVMSFLHWYGARKRRGMQSDARLSFGKYLVKIGLVFAFILVDLIFFPSLIQVFIPVSFYFFVAWGIGLLILVYTEKEIFDLALQKRT